ncbi:DNA N-glycosylase and apurinic/apyrimidinic (AP) lyase [Puttea exsequens]|nr:DNA N-glycosylase and apurinic/apyrimidinic (AP) lyase [Puttea exsequens]
MKTSGIPREIAKIATTSLAADLVPRRQTRAFAASLQAFAFDGGAPILRTPNKKVKREASDSDGSSVSSLSSGSVLDIEDLPSGSTANHKRKRGIGSPSTVVTSVSTATSTRTLPRKAGGKSEDGTVSKKKKAKRQPAKKIVNDAGEEEIRSPANWREVYDAVVEMRKERVAPVDTMGCETLAEEHVTPRDKRFQTLIALMLSSQTKDTTNAIAMRRLQTELPSPGLTLENILDVDSVKLNDMIYVVGFHNNKTRFIKAAAEIIRDQFDSDIPDTIDGLMSLPGVGPKMAYLCMSAAWGRTEGIGVDVHVHRITNLWGWNKTKGPEDTRAVLEAWLPRDKWHEINHLLVGFGQTVCLPVGRKCGECTLSEEGLCPSAVVEKKRILKGVKKETLKIGDDEGKVEVNAEDVFVEEKDAVAGDIQ